MWLLTLLLLSDSSHVRTIPVAARESLRVTEMGAGVPVVLLPGLFGSAYGYRHLLPLLAAAGYRAIVIEPLGIGESGRPARADYSLTAQADRIGRAVDSLGGGPVILVAHSVSASMAYRLAYRRPELVRGLVSIDGGAEEAAATPQFRRAMRLAPWIKVFGGVRLIRRYIRRALIAASGNPAWVTDEVVLAYTVGAADDLDATLTAYLRMAEAREPERLRDRLGTIRCPVRLVVGTASHIGGLSPAEIAGLRARLVDFAVDSAPGAGLYVFEEQPEAVAAAVDRLFRTILAHSAVPGR